ncbi:hypothetical protein [Jiella sonneratiae]|uniref:Uncharacterized protein n=1 Tax=Jiella sonneratiae TaxID=2816856 RepID=A0ABS3J4Q7_9HYPH|nr:hypothetical protein [Jiella sonneratiae]MBO0904663.1 hypothetical protein [Jiella sonneratiae]
MTKEVLPATRKTGGYLLNEEARQTAHADTREEMPLPEAFGKLMENMAEAIGSFRVAVEEEAASLPPWRNEI